MRRPSRQTKMQKRPVKAPSDMKKNFSKMAAYCLSLPAIPGSAPNAKPSNMYVLHSKRLTAQMWRTKRAGSLFVRSAKKRLMWRGSITCTTNNPLDHPYLYRRFLSRRSKKSGGKKAHSPKGCSVNTLTDELPIAKVTLDPSIIRKVGRDTYSGTPLLIVAGELVQSARDETLWKSVDPPFAESIRGQSQPKLV